MGFFFFSEFWCNRLLKHVSFTIKKYLLVNSKDKFYTLTSSCELTCANFKVVWTLKPGS